MTALIADLTTILASAAGLFLVASRLCIVLASEVVNFAHGSFFLIGAFLTADLAPSLGFWGACAVALAAAALLVPLLRLELVHRLYRAGAL